MNFDEIFGIHAQALTFRSKRSEVLSSNLANSDTPGYKARDIDFSQTLKKEVQGVVRVQTSNIRHIQPDSQLPSAAQLLYRTPMQSSLDGNTVDTEQEHVAFAQNAIEYQVSLKFLNDKINGLRKAIKGE